MRIVIVSSYNWENETGTAKVSERLSKHLSRNNKVLYLCLGPKYKMKNENSNFHILEIPAVKINGLWAPKITRKVKEKVFSDLTKFDPHVIHAQNIVFTGLISLMWARENNVPYVVTFHSLPSEGIRYIFPKLKNDKVVSKINYNLTKSYVKRFLENVNLIIALNNPVKRSIRSISKSIKIIVVRNGLELQNFFKLKANPPKDNHLNFIYLGTYSSRKNQEYLLRVFKHLPNNYKLDLYGNIETGKKYLKKLRQLIKSEKILNVRLNGFLSQKQVYKKLELANYFVSASIKEVQSLVIVEALAAGIPVIALKNETTSEIINEKNGLYFSKRTSAKIFAKKLKMFVEKTSPSYLEYASNCRKSVEIFDMKLVAQELKKAYKEAQNVNIESKKKGKLSLQIEALIPTPVKHLFENNVQKRIDKSKPNYLKFLLSLTFLLGIIFSIISNSNKLIKKLKKHLFNLY